MAWNESGSNPPAITLLSNETATGSWFFWPGGRGQVHIISSGWNSATAKLQRRARDGSTALDLGTDVTFTANSEPPGNFECPPCEIRVEISVATPSAGVYAWVEKIDP